MPIRQLLTLLIILISGHVRAQIPLQNTRWTGTVLMPDKRDVVVTFRNDTLSITATAGNARLEAMRYEQMGDTLYLQKLDGQSACRPTQIARYQLVYLKNSEEFTLQPISDDCPNRQTTLGSQAPFVRVRPKNQPPRNWPYLDPTLDSVAGMSLYRAYELLSNRPSVPVVVGVLDSGVDLSHEDLRDVAWVNTNETPDNNTDDDKNGYTDDRNGWNFMGAKDGTTYEYDQPEISQSYLLLRAKYDTANPAKLSPADKRQYDTYQAAKKQYLPRYQASRAKRLAFADTVRFWQVAEQIQKNLPDSVTSQRAIRAVNLGTDSVAIAVQNVLAEAYEQSYGPFAKYADLVRQNWARFRLIVGSDASIAYNPDYNPRRAVGDNPADLTERYYGSPRMRIGTSEQLAVHGSHVAGIIGAKRGNGRGIDGVADNVRIMPVSVVPANGDERDKDVANGIRYAVENGAKVINMSFGKRLSPFSYRADG